VAPKPATLDMAQAAALPLVALTAWQALVEQADLQRGQKVFIQAGSGGVGSIAIQLAHHLGAMVATTAGAANSDWVRALGADVVIDYRKDDFAAVLRDYDVVLHSQDTQTLQKSLRILKPGGKLISISGPPDPAFARSIGAPWYMRLVVRLLSSGVRRTAKRLGVDFSFLFMRADGRQLRRIGSLVDAGILRPVVDRVMPFDDANEALAYVEAGHAKGKVVLSLTP
jgi:alcohol dehydrogenase